MTQNMHNGILRDLTAEEQADYDARISSERAKRPQYKLEKIRAIRFDRLRETDYLANSDMVMTDEMKSYRQGMRDIPQNYTTEEEYDLILTRNEDGALTHSIWNKP